MLTNFQIVPRTVRFLTITNASNHFTGCINSTDLPRVYTLKEGVQGALTRALDDEKTAKVPTSAKVGQIYPRVNKEVPINTTL